MAHAIRHERFGRTEAAGPRAKALRPTVSAHASEVPSDKRPTLRPTSRQSGIQLPHERLGRPEPYLGACLAEEVIADHSKDPRHDR